MAKNSNFRTKNFVILGLGALLAASVFVVVNDPEIFQANVLGVQDQETLQQNDRDLGYKTENNELVVFVADLEEYQKIELVVDFDPDKISFDMDSLDNQGEIEIVENDGFLNISVDVNSGDAAESLFVLNFVGDLTDLLVSDAKVLKNNEIIDLSIGNLDKKEVHR